MMLNIVLEERKTYSVHCNYNDLTVKKKLGCIKKNIFVNSGKNQVKREKERSWPIWGISKHSGPLLSSIESWWLECWCLMMLQETVMHKQGPKGLILVRKKPTTKREIRMCAYLILTLCIQKISSFLRIRKESTKYGPRTSGTQNFN